MSQVLNVLGKVISSRRFCSHGSLLLCSPTEATSLNSTILVNGLLNFVELSGFSRLRCQLLWSCDMSCNNCESARACASPLFKKYLAVSIETPKHVLLEIQLIDQRARELELVAGLAS